MATSLVSVDWLFENLKNPNLVILDATIKKVTSPNSGEESTKEQIKGAHFFDIKNKFSEVSAPFPNTILSPKEFQDKVRKLGINNDSIIVVYDDLGIYSSPRAWWLFKSMGHKNVAVLNGGLLAWKEAKYPIEKQITHLGNIGNFKVNYNPTLINNYKEVLNSISNKDEIILDARSENRFKGIDPEPRKGLRSGHIPASKNLPYSELIVNNKLKNKKELKNIFTNLISEDQRIIFSCGSGITACILALGAEIAGYEENVSVYDGSWTEWGSLLELPIEK